MTDNDDRVFFNQVSSNINVFRNSVKVEKFKQIKQDPFTDLKEAIEWSNFDRVKEIFENEKSKNSTFISLILNTIINFVPFLKRCFPETKLIETKDESGNSVLHHINKHSKLNSQEILEFLLENNADPNAVNNAGYSALQWQSILAENALGIKTLLENNADPNISNILGVTPLETAILKNSPEKIIVLLGGGANPNSLNEQQSPFSLFLDNVKRYDLDNFSSSSAFDNAQRAKNLDIIKEFLLHGASTPDDKEEIVVTMFGNMDNYIDFMSSISHYEKSAATNL